jgi:hypothetical protein
MSKLTFITLETLFLQSYPQGSLIKQTNTKYQVCFNATDNRTDTEKEVDTFGIVSTDKRKYYTYYANNLIQLATKLKIETPETEYKMSTLNQEWEAMIKDDTDYSFELFGE